MVRKVELGTEVMECGTAAIEHKNVKMEHKTVKTHPAIDVGPRLHDMTRPLT